MSITRLHRLRRNEDGIPEASSFRMFRCSHCPHIHIELKDEDNKTFAVMIIDDDQAMAIGREGEDPGQVVGAHQRK